MTRPPTRVFDTRQVRRAFSRASAGYETAAGLQREIESRLFESLDYLDDRVPDVVLDVGSGPGHGARAMRERWPKARIIALDLALPMLQQGETHEAASWRSRLRLRKPIDRVCADLRALPLADGSVEVLFSNLCLQWVDDLAAAFAEFRRVLKPGGLLLCSTFGPETLHELHHAFSQADAAPHVSPFASIADVGDGLVRAGFRDPVLDRDVIVHGHADLASLMRELRTLGATNALRSRRSTLTGRARFAAAERAYESLRGGDGLLPASWEAITAMAWSPDPGAPIRGHAGEIASFPADRIPVRRR